MTKKFKVGDLIYDKENNIIGVLSASDLIYDENHISECISYLSISFKKYDAQSRQALIESVIWFLIYSNFTRKQIFNKICKAANSESFIKELHVNTMLYYFKNCSNLSTYKKNTITIKGLIFDPIREFSKFPNGTIDFDKLFELLLKEPVEVIENEEELIIRADIYDTKMELKEFKKIKLKDWAATQTQKLHNRYVLSKIKVLTKKLKMLENSIFTFNET